MAVFVCGCGARTQTAGRCLMCGADLGSPRLALLSAGIAASLLTAIWIGFSVLVGMQPLPLALVYGAVVSGVVAVASGGRGLRYQAIASGFALLGLGVADAVSVYYLWTFGAGSADYSGTQPGAWEVVSFHAQNDALTVACCVTGLMGGMFLWWIPQTSE